MQDIGINGINLTILMQWRNNTDFFSGGHDTFGQQQESDPSVEFE